MDTKPLDSEFPAKNTNVPNQLPPLSKPINVMGGKPLPSFKPLVPINSSTSANLPTTVATSISKNTSPILSNPSIPNSTIKPLPTKISPPTSPASNSSGNTRLVFNVPNYKPSPPSVASQPKADIQTTRPKLKSPNSYKDHLLGPGITKNSGSIGTGRRYQDHRLAYSLEAPLPPGAGEGKKYQDHRLGPGIVKDDSSQQQ